MDFKERERRAKGFYLNEHIYPNKNTAINRVIENFNPKYFYHIFDIDAYVFEPFTIDNSYYEELNKFRRKNIE